MLAGMSDDDSDVVNRRVGTTLENYKNAKLYNLYLDPKERYSFFDRQTFMDNLFTRSLDGAHGDVPEVPVEADQQRLNRCAVASSKLTRPTLRLNGVSLEL